MAQQTLRCYHHHNCEDRPAVAHCSKCGKGLCRECVDNLKSKTGEILCVDCLNEENVTDAAWAEVVKGDIKKEMITILVGFIIGLAIEIFLLVMSQTAKSETWDGLLMISWFLFLPTLLASLKTIVTRAHLFRQKISYRFDSLIIKLICYSISVTFFFILCFVSPIMFVWRLVKRAKDVKLFKEYVNLQFVKYQKNQEYAELAASMTTRLTTEEFERKLRLELSTELEENKEETERKISEMAANYNREMDEKDKKLHSISVELNEAQSGMAAYKEKYENSEKKNQKLQKQNAQTKRKTINVDDDDIAA
ncbi:MAG: hypothetical protein HDT29_07250 [Clostridiales bacterium]|nr:hypothetical protein [Clostridiales bacterium]